MPGNSPHASHPTRLLRAVHLLAGLALEPTETGVRFSEAPDLLAQAILILDDRQLLPWHALKLEPTSTYEPPQLRPHFPSSITA